MTNPQTILNHTLLAAAFVLAGCTVGPDYKGPPRVISPAQTSFYRAGEAPVSAGPVVSQWWLALNDPQLNRLETAALAANPDIEAAVARLRQSRASLHEQRADLLPNTGGSATDLHVHSGGSGVLGTGDDLKLYSAGFDATWEADLFGGQRRAIESAADSAQAQRADLADTQVSLTAEVAQAYVSLRDLQQRRALTRASADLQGKMLGLTQQREAGGTATELDVERLYTQAETTQADLIPLQAQIEAELDRLAILTGEVPGSLDGDLAPAGPLPLPPARVAVGDPAALLRRRPDIRAAERQIAAQNAVIGERVADLFPKVSLLGDVGFSSTDAGELFTPGSLMEIGAPILQWKPFDFGRTEAKIGEATADRDAAIAHYRATVLSALDDAETALSNYGLQRQDVASLARVNASADRAAVLSRQRYTAGTASLIDTLDTERQRFDAETNLAQAEAQMTQDYIGLQKSLGLGWREQ